MGLANAATQFMLSPLAFYGSPWYQPWDGYDETWLPRPSIFPPYNGRANLLSPAIPSDTRRGAKVSGETPWTKRTESPQQEEHQGLVPARPAGLSSVLTTQGSANSFTPPAKSLLFLKIPAKNGSVVTFIYGSHTVTGRWQRVYFEYLDSTCVTARPIPTRPP